jgi:hypothetical protein
MSLEPKKYRTRKGQNIKKRVKRSQTGRGLQVTDLGALAQNVLDCRFTVESMRYPKA